MATHVPLALCVLVSLGAPSDARPSEPKQDGVYHGFEQALREPEKVRRLDVDWEDLPGATRSDYLQMKHLPSGLGRMVNLESLDLSCLEMLEDLPEEIGRLRNLKELVIDNGNGCGMNVALPASMGRLTSLRKLTLWGAFDRDGPVRRDLGNLLPPSMANLKGLEELELGRNGLLTVPPTVRFLRGLRKLGLDYNHMDAVPGFVGDLSALEELSLNGMHKVALPPSLARLKGLKVSMGNNELTLKEQKALRERFPNVAFSFENEIDDGAANEEAPPPRP